MSISLDAPVFGKEGNSLDVGVFVGEYVIKSVEDLSNYTREGKKDLHLKLVCKKDANERTLHVFGRFIRGKDKEIIKWNNNNNGVLFLFVTLFGSISSLKINNDFSIPKTFLKSMEGKSFIAINYVNGKYNEKPSYSTWFKFFVPGTPDDLIYDTWANNKPYNYKPIVYETYQQIKKINNETYVAEIPPDSPNTSIKNDDLPF